MNLSKFVLIIIMFIFLITLLILVTSASWGGLLTGQEPCISNNEQAVYSVKSYGTKGYMKVGVSDKTRPNHMRSKFQITAWVDPRYPPEIHKCGIYVVRSFNYNIIEHSLNKNVSVELWQYSYDGNGKQLLILASTDENGNYNEYFHFNFSIDDTETHVALERGTGGNKDHQLILRDLQTGQEKLLLTGMSFYNTNVEICDFEPISWTQGKLSVRIVGRLSDTDIEISEPYATDSWKIKSNIEHHFEIDDKIYAGVVSNTNSTPPLINHDNCLSKNETSSHKKYSERKNEYTDSITEEITIFNANLDYKTSSFLIPNVDNSIYSIIFRTCGVYVLRAFNNKIINYGLLPGASYELWHYSYNGTGKKLLTFSESDVRGRPRNYFSFEFSIDDHEKFLVLERGYSGTEDHAIIFKRLDTLQNILVLSVGEMLEKLPGISGYPSFGRWSKDGRYLWGGISFAAENYARFRIDTINWTYEVFSLLDDKFNGGGVVEPNTGWMDYDTGSIWTGDAEYNESYRQERKKQGKSSDLHIYNLFTKEDRLIESTKEDPIWFYKPEWISENELEHELPSGEKKMYNIETKEYKLISERLPKSQL